MGLQLQFLREKIATARNLLGVVETMRGLAAVNIRRAEAVAGKSAKYARTVHLSLHAALSSMSRLQLQRAAQRAQSQRVPGRRMLRRRGSTTMLVITTDMGLCGQFNERIVEYALNLSRRIGSPCRWIVVGARGWERLRDADVDLVGRLDAPGSVEAIPTVVSGAFVSLTGYLSDERIRLLVVHNRPDDTGAFTQHHLQLAPFQPERWLRWPNGESPWYTPPMTSSDPEVLLPYLVREQVFIDLFQAFIQSFAAENAARLSSMRNAADNIEELLSDLELRYRRERQDVITNELMELLGGVQAVSATE